MTESSVPQSTHQRTALINGRIVLPDSISADQVVLIEDGKIVAITHLDAMGDANPIDVGGRWITPGLIDLHTHGALGHTFNEPTGEAFARDIGADGYAGDASRAATLAKTLVG